MRRRTFASVGFLLSVLVMLSSCDDSMTRNLQNILGPFNKNNVYIDSGLIVVTTTDVDTVVTSVTESTGKDSTVQAEVVETGDNGEVTIELSSSGSSETSSNIVSAVSVIAESLMESADSVSVFSLTTDSALASIITGNGVLSAQDSYVSTEIAESIAAIGNSPSASSDLVTALSTECTDADASDSAKGTIALIAAVIDLARTELTSLDENYIELMDTAYDVLYSAATQETPLTNGQVLEMQLLTNLVVHSADAIASLLGSGLENISTDSMLSVLDEATTLLSVSDLLGDSSILGISGILSNVQLS